MSEDAFECVIFRLNGEIENSRSIRLCKKK